MPPSMVCIDHGQVAGELVMTCWPMARSYQALWRIPWWPGWAPVRMVVWLASVTDGSDAMAPWPKPVPMASRRARLGTSPAAIRS